MLQIQFLHKSDLDELCKQEKKKTQTKPLLFSTSRKQK